MFHPEKILPPPSPPCSSSPPRTRAPSNISSTAFYYVTDGAQVTIVGFSGDRAPHNYFANVVIPSIINGLPVTGITNYAFNGNPLLSSITIPDSVTNFGDYVFAGCQYLTNAVFGNGLTNLGTAAFRGLQQPPHRHTSRLSHLHR